MSVDVQGEKYKGREWLNKTEEVLRRAYLNRQVDEPKNPDVDYMWKVQVLLCLVVQK